MAVYCGKDSGFEVIHGLLNRVMEMLRVPLAGEGWKGTRKCAKNDYISNYSSTIFSNACELCSALNTLNTVYSSFDRVQDNLHTHPCSSAAPTRMRMKFEEVYVIFFFQERTMMNSHLSLRHSLHCRHKGWQHAAETVWGWI